VPDQLGLGREVVQQCALVAAQVVGHHRADRHRQRRQRGRHHDRDQLGADRALADHAASAMREHSNGMSFLDQ
jgi:hypothetical protein